VENKAVKETHDAHAIVKGIAAGNRRLERRTCLTAITSRRILLNHHVSIHAQTCRPFARVREHAFTHIHAKFILTHAHPHTFPPTHPHVIRQICLLENSHYRAGICLPVLVSAHTNTRKRTSMYLFSTSVGACARMSKFFFCGLPCSCQPHMLYNSVRWGPYNPHCRHSP
jgi:hypothetical protein